MIQKNSKIIIAVFLALISILILWWSFKKPLPPTIKEAIEITDTAKKEVTASAVKLRDNRTTNDLYIKEQKKRSVETVPSSSNIDALIDMANEVIRRGRENRLSDSTDVGGRPTGAIDPES